MEKFALLNLLNLLQGLAPKPDGGQKPSVAEAPADGQPAPQPSTSAAQEQPNAYPNVMASVLERHEMIANRVKNKK